MRRFLPCLIGLLCYASFAQTGTLEKYILVDQFGYRPNDEKVAVISDPQIGFNADDSFNPGDTYQVRKWSNDQVVFEGTPVAWRNGETHSASGDRGWHFDFGEVTQNGDFYIYDVERNKRSYRFKISNDVYLDVLKAAMKTFYYQRVGINKVSPYAEAPWRENDEFYEQDGQATSVANKGNASTAKDLSGGWMDAGDPNKYVTFASEPVHQLLDSYQDNPEVWNGLDLNIPESNNSVPDILDEVKWELDWLLKMQDSDGGVYIKMGLDDFRFENPANDNRPRYYEQKCSASTLAAGAMFAHGYLVFKDISGMSAYANTLLDRAEKAWDNFLVNDQTFDSGCDTREICCGKADRGLREQKGYAAILTAYMFGATGENKYNQGFLAHYEDCRHMLDPYDWGRWENHLAEALTYYTTIPNADNTAKTKIESAKQLGSNDTKFRFDPNSSLYRAYSASNVWGVNKARSNSANASYDYFTSGSNPSNDDSYVKRAINQLHYLHGVNALGMVFLTNMDELGGEYSASEIHHTYFHEGSRLSTYTGDGPAPGYLVGGANTEQYNLTKNSGNTYYIKRDGADLDALLYDQPTEKYYTDATYNVGSGPSYFWAMNENSITYQGAYVKLLANFIGVPDRNGTPDPQIDPEANSVSATLPTSGQVGGTYNANVNYVTDRESIIQLKLYDLANGGFNGIVSQELRVGFGSGTVQMSFDIPADLQARGDYGVLLQMFNTDFSEKLTDQPVGLVTLTNGDTPPPTQESSITANLPNQVNAGSVLNTSISYSAAESGHIFLNLQWTDANGEWQSYGDGASQNVAAGSGSVNLSLSIPESVPAGRQHFFFLNLFNSDYSGTLASTSNQNVTIITDDGGGNGTGDIIIRARGNCGSEQMELRVDGTLVKTWNSITTDFGYANYTYSGFSGGEIRVSFTNDGNVNGCDRNLDIDKITVCDEVYETEDTATKGPGCGDADSLWCTGYFDYGNISCSGSDNNTGINYYYIRNKELGDYLRPASADNNAQILVQENDNSDWFQWEKVTTNNGYFFLKNKETGKYFRPADNVDVKTDGSVMQQKPTDWDGSYTQWTEVDSGDGTYVHIANRQTGLYFRALNNNNRYLVARPTGWSGSWTRWIFEPVSTSLKANLPKEQITEMLIYPNPARNQLHLQGQVNGNYTIFDISGRSVKMGALSGKAETTIDITSLETGMYLLNIPGKTFKFVKE